MGGIDRTISWPRVIMHVDMDAFFAAIEMRNMPLLKNRPVIVGGDPRFRSVVSTCNYIARQYGVRSGMPASEAKRLCPEAVFVSGTLGNYTYTSAKIQTVFENYTPQVQPLSVDEAVMDITGCHRIFGTVENLVQSMKRELNDKVGLTCSVGIAPNKYLAKLASGENKPDGMTIMDGEDFKKRFYCRPVDSLWGIGPSTKAALNKMGIITVEDLSCKEERRLKGAFGVYGTFLSKISQGQGSEKVYNWESMQDEKSMSHETTLRKDIFEIDRIYSVLLWLSGKVAKRLRRGGFKAKTISVKVRSSDFKTITRDRTLAVPTDQEKIIYENARKLVPPEYGPRFKIRLLGVKASNLIKDDEEIQLCMIPDSSGEKLSKSSRVIDALRGKYGDEVIKMAGTNIY